MHEPARIKVSVSKKIRTSLNGLGVFVDHKTVFLFYRTRKDKQTFHIAKSEDGLTFSKMEKDAVIHTGKFTRAISSHISQFSITRQNKHFMLTYVWSNGKRRLLEKAWSKDLVIWKYEGQMIDLSEQGVLAPDFHFQGKHIMYVGEETISAYFSKDLIHWEKLGSQLHTDSGILHEVSASDIGCVLLTDKGLLLIYHTRQNGIYTALLLLLDRNDPTHILWCPQEPLWTAPSDWENARPFGIINSNGRIVAYWQTDTGITAVVYALYQTSDGHVSKDISLRLKRADKNPLIAPKEDNHWEAFNTFNPAAVYDNGKVHLLYRAQGYNYVSVLGYAASNDGVHIDERLEKPIYLPTEPFEFVGEKKPSDICHFYVSGGGFGGCEDPRMTLIDDRYYLTYVAFDGVSPPRVALTSIDRADFLNKHWLWKKPILISPPGVVDKSAVIFPEKVNGKYVIMHRIYPDILIDYVDSLQFDGTKWLRGQYKISPRKNFWDSRKIGAGAPPIKTRYGWLLIYQSVGEQDPGRYKIGAMLLDLTNPAKVLYRSQSPILEPEVHYENDGFKAGVIYPCGAVVIKDTLYVYYGGADSYVCAATANLEEFLAELRFSDVARLTTPIIETVL